MSSGISRNEIFLGSRNTNLDKQKERIESLRQTLCEVKEVTKNNIHKVTEREEKLKVLSDKIASVNKPLAGVHTSSQIKILWGISTLDSFPLRKFVNSLSRPEITVLFLHISFKPSSLISSCLANDIKFFSLGTIKATQ
uniref:V-SNARE coiled-coil homology domain-containing protein n=1 Tax=Strongyloides venezuelensis TaxID=75913 RepID=A0A0K0F9D0_STRVS